MNVRRDTTIRHCSIAGGVLIAAVFAPVGYAEASPWVLPKGTSVLGVKAGTDFASREFLIDDRREQEFPLNGEFEAYRLELSARYGFFEGLEGGARIELKNVSYISDPVIIPTTPDDEQLCNELDASLEGCRNSVSDFTSSQSGFGDLYLNTVVQHLGGSARAASNIEIKIPTGYDEPEGTFVANQPSTAILDDIALGDGRVHIQYRLETGVFFPSTGTVFEFAGGYRARLGAPGDQTIGEIKLGQNVGERLFVFLGADAAYTIFEGRALTDDRGEVATTFVSNSPATPAEEFELAQAEEREFRLDYDFARATGGLIIRLAGREIVLSASTIFWGDNIARLSNVSLGVLLPFS